MADPGQVENALLNLAINARDAMSGSGRLEITIANRTIGEEFLRENPEAVEGQFVVMSVTDNGTGMSDDVLEHAYEPFFTTKEVGEGSGLGLSMVYGFAKQSGGHVTIQSEEGRGTTVSLYLPMSTDPVISETAQKTSTITDGNGEVILVVEDDDDVRELSVMMLNGLGYRVLAAADATSAHEILERHERIDLVLSDVVLPGGLSGPDFVIEEMVRHPGLRAIFMSGYPNDVVAREALAGAVILNKPFQLRQMAETVRAALD